MAFPFPQNPVNGQTVSHLAADGSLLKATYSSAKNCWNVERAIHQAPVLLSRAGVSIPTATADKQVMMWDATANQWVASTIALSTKDLADVDRTTTPADQYFLLFDAALNKYKPVPLTGGAVLTATTVGLNNQIGTGTVSAALTALFKVARPASNPKGGDAYIITPVRTNSALDKLSGTYLYDGTNWVRAANDSGGAAAHYRATSATAQEPGSKIGDLDILNELNNHQLNAYDGTNYQTVFSEQAIKQWIAAGSLFQGTLKTDPDLTALPAAGPTNRGFYWTWTGAPSHVITTPIAVTLQVGDWIQSDGTRYIHVPSDLMSKQRWSSVGSFRTWADTDYELDTLIYHNFKLYRATSAIVAGDVEPGAAGSKWQELQIKLTIEELSNVNDNASAYGQDCILVWDEANQEWTASRSLEIDDITFDESGPGNTLTGFAQFNMNVPAPFTEDTWVPSVMAVKDAIAGISIEELVDTKELSKATDGDAVTYNATNGRWEPSAIKTGSLSDITDVNIASIPNDGAALTWDAATSKWVPDASKFIPYFTGKYGPGTLSGGTTWVPWSNPKEGDIWVNKNTTTPHFEVYENGAWKVWNFATETRALGLLGDLANVDLGSKAPGNGDALIWNVKKEQWVSGNTPAHIAQYTASSVYSEGTTVYYKGGIFKATGVIAANESPEFLTGDVFLFYRAQADGSGDFGGPYRVFRVEKVADATLPPTFTPPTNGKTNCVCYKDDRNWSVWEWVMVDFVNLTYGWVRKDGAYTKRTLWRSHFLPTKNKGTFVLWVVDDTKGTTVPKAREYPWEMLPIRGDLAALHDCHVDDPQDGDALVFNGTTNLWEAVPSSALSLKMVALTQAAYDAIATKDPLTLYIISA